VSANPDTPPAYDRIVPYSLPPTLSPSRVSAFTECALAFRFASLDRLPEPPAPHLTRGTLVHLALERLFVLPPAERTPEQAGPCLDAAVAALRDDGEFTGLGLDTEGEAAFVADARRLVDRYFTMEDPTAVHAVGLEVQLRADVGGVQLTGIIDRLDRTHDGGFVVVDYKTGAAPSADVRADRAHDAVRRAEGRRGLGDDPAGQRGRLVPPEARTALLVVQLPDLLPRVRRRPRGGPPAGRAPAGRTGRWGARR
jgi:RecB family exonuclease